MPSTPARSGSERASRRKTIAASLRYGRLSNMPVVPCVRPSHGSEQKPAKGMVFSRAKFLRRRLHEQADFPMAGVIAERDRFAVRRAQSALRAEDEKLFAPDFGGIPAHAGVLRQAEQIAARAVAAASPPSAADFPPARWPRVWIR